MVTTQMEKSETDSLLEGRERPARVGYVSESHGSIKAESVA